MRRYSKEYILQIARGLPFEEYRQEMFRIIEFGRNPLIVAETLVKPEIIGKSYNLNVLKEIFSKLAEKDIHTINRVGKALVFYEGDTQLDAAMRENAKAILIHLARGNLKSLKTIEVVCGRMFRNTGEEPFEIVEEVVSKNIQIFYKLAYYLRKRLREEKNEEEARILRERMVRTIFNIFKKNKENDESVREMVGLLIFNVTKDKLLEDALVEIGKESSAARRMVNTWKDRDGVDRTKALYRVEQRIKGENPDKELMLKKQPTAPVHGFRGRKHRSRY